MFKKLMLAGISLVSFAGLNANHVEVRKEEKEERAERASFDHRKAVNVKGDGIILTIRTNKQIFTQAIKAGDIDTINFNGTIEALELESANITDGKAHVNNRAKRFIKSGHPIDTKLLIELQNENHWEIAFIRSKNGKNHITIKAVKN